ncbi:hypothetical protein BB934_36715 (plasmid) [Microvirga ossetica]|uniref:HTH tetR-type domain-containing protein n=2 Tax=Microvirga ossetica TaxID=1882682 RepID=A0A1B2EUY5_9HYPH|nr:hypothetical protein BB934_36715 [Microvirga ossetica]
MRDGDAVAVALPSMGVSSLNLGCWRRQPLFFLLRPRWTLTMIAHQISASSPVRDRILDAAEELICIRGVGSLTLEAVAHMADVSKGGILYHFRSKDCLISGLQQRLAEHLEERLRDTKHQPLPVLLAFLRELRQSYEAGGRCFAPLLLAREQQDPCPELQTLMTNLIRRSDVSDSRDGGLLLFASLGLVLASLTRIPHLKPEQAQHFFNRLEDAADVLANQPREEAGVP